MKVSLTSDWHFEFTDNADMIHAMMNLQDLNYDLNIVAGDVHSNKLLADYFEQEVPNCFMIQGNHDFYGRKLENNVKTLDVEGLSVLGCTLWTNFDEGNDLVKNLFKRGMADARHIKTEGDIVEEIAAINKHNFELIMDTQPDIVVTHHCPTLRSIHPRFANDGLFNYNFSNDYEKYLTDTKIKYWVFGHTHWRHQYEIGNTTFICNPRGYPSEIKEAYTPVVFDV